MIIITAYHGRKNDPNFESRKKYLEETISSIDKQLYKNIVHIIVDDGSTDDFCALLKEKYKNNKNKVVIRRTKPEGEILTASNAINYAIDLCLNNNNIENVDITNHDTICFIDSDDLVIDIHKRVREIENNKLDLLYTDALIFFDNNPKVFFWKGMFGTYSKIFNNFWVLGKMPYPTMTWKKDFLLGLRDYNKQKYNVNGILDSQIGCGQDVDLALSSFEYAKSKNLKIGYLSEITAAYRIHESSIAVIRNQNQRSKEENIVIVRHFGKIKSLYLHLKRFLVRPECYFPNLMTIRNFFRKKSEKSFYLK